MSKMSDNRVMFRAPAVLEEWLRACAGARMESESLGAAAQAELELWRTALHVEQARVKWTVAELCAIADMLGGTIPLPGLGQRVAMEVSDTVELYPDSYGDKWGIDEAALLRKARTLGPVADHATIDGIGKFWANPDMDGRDADAWRRLGFRVE